MECISPMRPKQKRTTRRRKQPLTEEAAIRFESDQSLRDLAVLEERDRIARELHDGVIQSIYSVTLALRGSISLLRQDPDLANQRIARSIAELDNIAKDVRTYIFELRPELVEENGLVWAINELLKDLKINTLAHTSVDLHPTCVAALDDEQQRHVILIVRELLSNIVKHGHASEVIITCSKSKDEAVLEIADDGVGFDPGKVQRGQGLANIERRAEKLGGVVEVKPRIPKGMIFTVRIPLKEGEWPRRSGKLRVMLVDDHDVVREGLRSLLEAEEDIEVVAETDSGKDAVHLVRMHKPRVVVMDVRMPEGSGVEACREIRDQNPDTQVIMLTSFSDEEALFNSVMAGAAGFVLKRGRGRDLIGAIREVGTGQSLLDQETTRRLLHRLRNATSGEKDPKLARLSPQEDRILDLIGEGLTNREIARRVHLSDNTVKHYVSAVLQKLEVSRRTDAALYLARVRGRSERPA
jgi:two-component system, NarL family, response regulator DevR